MKSKRLTIREKKDRAEVRKELRAEGILPPIKKKLNRRKFCREVRIEYMDKLNRFEDIKYLYEAISWMLPSSDAKFKFPISSEEIGIAKVLKAAVEIKKFNEEKIAQGEKTYKIDEIYKNIIEPIRNL